MVFECLKLGAMPPPPPAGKCYVMPFPIKVRIVRPSLPIMHISLQLLWCEEHKKYRKVTKMPCFLRNLRVSSHGNYATSTSSF